MVSTVLALRKQELARRIGRLPEEVQAWKAATEGELDKNAHFTQLRAIEVLTDEFLREQQAMLARLDPASDAGTFHRDSMELVSSLIRSQKTWDFFRDKLNLRHSPQHRAPLWVADTVAWDCHRPVLDRAVQLGIVNPNELREAPLVYCSAEYSPATWVRGSRPNDGRAYDLGEALLPIPVIEIPWDHLGSAWEFLALHHEVGHDIEADLRLRPALIDSLLEGLARERVPLQRRTVWTRWAGEVFADLCALQLGGPAFAEVLMHLLLLPERDVKIFDDKDPHPTPYIRILLNAAYIRTLGSTAVLNEHAVKIETRWKALYGESSGDVGLDAFQDDFPCVFQALMDTQQPGLKGHSVRETIPFGDAQDGRIRAAVKFFRTGMYRPNGLPPRHTVSAARMAVGAEAEAGNLSDRICVEIHERVIEYVRESAPRGLRGGGPDPHEKFIASFARRVFP
jgi:hypothetical protein